jgi:hypothetical protein
MSLIRKLVVLPSVAGFVLSANAFLSTAAAQPAGQPAAQPAATGADTVTKEKVIAGTMDIDFATRTNLDTSGDLKPNSPALGAKDTYKFTLSVAETTEFAGKIERQPNLFTKTLARRKQDAQLWYSIDLSLFNPRDLKVKKTVGKWVGTIPIDTASGRVRPFRRASQGERTPRQGRSRGHSPGLRGPLRRTPGRQGREERVPRRVHLQPCHR